MMDYSLTLKSSLEFILAGPLGEGSEGIIVKSTSLDLSLVGHANKIYQQGAFNSKNKREEFETYVWSRNFTVSDRQVRFLFCWRELTEEGLFMGRRYYKFDEIENELDRFIENSFRELTNLMFDYRLNKGSSKIIVDEAKILWDISPLIAMCM